MNLYACVQGRASCRLAIGAVAIASILPVPSKATENGQVHYPIGVNTIMNAALPAPGETGFYLYTQYYESTRLNDGKGRSVDPNFKASVYAVVPRIVHSWNQRVGPFWLSSGAIVPPDASRSQGGRSPRCEYRHRRPGNWTNVFQLHESNRDVFLLWWA